MITQPTYYTLADKVFLQHQSEKDYIKSLEKSINRKIYKLQDIKKELSGFLEKDDSWKK